MALLPAVAARSSHICRLHTQGVCRLKDRGCSVCNAAWHELARLWCHPHASAIVETHVAAQVFVSLDCSDVAVLRLHLKWSAHLFEV
jgi:hypothetical protein